MNKIPIIDLFAGPGGLGEGFSQVKHKNNEPVFEIKLSIEKDENAHTTLELRSFFRKLSPDERADYYEFLKSESVTQRNEKKQDLFNKYPEEYEEAKKEAWRVTLGEKNPAEVDARIKESLAGEKNWVLIGGPPCQAYSLAGRSRVGGIDPNDHRVYLYKEYLRIIAEHHPAVFVMENVKGLLSAQVNGEKVINWILRDLRNPRSVFHESRAPEYKIYSFTTEPSGNINGSPVYSNVKDYLIRSELYGIPQKRHRVILLGIREDISARPKMLIKKDPVKLVDIIGDLPVLRSGLNREFESVAVANGKKKRKYRSVADTNKKWLAITKKFRKQISGWHELDRVIREINFNNIPDSTGKEFIAWKFSGKNPLSDWYYDENLNGVINHESRYHLVEDLQRYLFASIFAIQHKRSPNMTHFQNHSEDLIPDHESARSGKFADRFRVQLPDQPATTVTSHISKDGHYFIHYDPVQCRSLTVREAARIQTFPDNYLFCGARTAQFHQVGNAVPPFLAKQIGELIFNLF